MSQQRFSSLPYELLLHIISFGVDRELSNHTCNSRNSQIVFVAKFQSLNRKINSIKEMKNFFDEFWWKVFEKYLGNNQEINNDLEQLKKEMIKKNELKRKILLAKYIKFQLLTHKIDNRIKNSFDNEVKVVTLGEGGVGKSSLTISFVQNIFLDDYEPSFEDSYRKQTIVDNNTVLFDIMDPAFYEENPERKEGCLRYGKSFIIVCSVDSIRTLNFIEPLIELMIRVKDLDHVVNVPIVFAITRIDILTSDNMESTLKQYRNGINDIIKKFSLVNTSIIETSAKTGHNVTLLHEDIARRYWNGTIDIVTLLKNVIELDVDFIECQTGEKKSEKKCHVM